MPDSGPLTTLPVPPDSERYVPRSGPEGGVCAICGRPPKTRKLHVDHAHGVHPVEAEVRAVIAALDEEVGDS